MSLRILIFGIGNPGRRDDGLGPALLQELERRGTGRHPAESRDPIHAPGFETPSLHIEFRCQLNIEDAETMKGYDIVVFADATTEGDAPVTLTELEPAGTIAITTHAMAPASVLALCQELYGRRPEAFTLAIRGYDWGIGEGLSERAASHLDEALDRLAGLLSDRDRTRRKT